MRSIGSILAVLVAASVAHGMGVPSLDLYTPVPGVGYMFSECVHSIPSDTKVSVKDTHTELLHANGTMQTLPLCAELAKNFPVIHPMSSKTSLRGVDTANDDVLPADYDGWLQYTQWEYKAGLNAFTGYFSVPQAPASFPQILFLFTGLQNIPWIPKVDPIPSEEFDIIQPVLQYPADNGNGWSVKSWYVTLKAGALQSPEVPLAVGDKVWGNMTRTGPESWVIISQSHATGKSTVTHATGSRVQTQPYAYTTVECYGCNGCSTYPPNDLYFTDMILLDENSSPVQATWQNTPQQPAKLECHEKTTIASSASITYSFQ